MDSLKQFLETSAGKAVLFGLVVVVIGVVGWFAVDALTGSAVRDTGNRVFIDAETGDEFRHTLEFGETQPIMTPDGNQAGYEAEPCYWTKEGQPKEDPTWVLVKQKIDPDAEATFCPDCGRLVTERNAPAGPGRKAPPTRSEYEKQQKQRSAPTEPAPEPTADPDARDGDGDGDEADNNAGKTNSTTTPPDTQRRRRGNG